MAYSRSHLMQARLDGGEEQALIVRYGPTGRYSWCFQSDQDGDAYWLQAIVRLQRAELVMTFNVPMDGCCSAAKALTQHMPFSHRRHRVG